MDGSFFQFDGDPRLADQVILRIRERFHVELAPGGLIEARTVANIAARVEHLLIARLDSITDEEAERLLAELQ